MQEKWPAEFAQSTEDRAQSTEHRAQSTEHRALSKRLINGFNVGLNFRALSPVPKALRHYQLESYHDLTSVTNMPAVFAASIPRSPSSKTSHNSGSIFIKAAHLRKVSG